MVDDAPPDERELAKSQLAEAEQHVAELEAELGRLLVPRDENDGKNVIVTIRGAEGGDEANLFARDLYDMYLRYADRRHWRVEVLEHAGLRSRGHRRGDLPRERSRRLAAAEA